MACGSGEYSPKPKAYPRIDLPSEKYQKLDSDCPFVFDYNLNSVVQFPNSIKNPCWLNIDYPFLKGRLHLSYKIIEDDLNSLLEDSRALVYKHTVKASAINESELIDSSKNVYARVYELEGNAASSVQFYATDGTKHFMRGAFYFNAKTNADSLRPAILYIRDDVRHLIETLNWK